MNKMKNQLEINIRKSMEPTWKELLIPIYRGLNYIKRTCREIKSLSEENNGIIRGCEKLRERYKWELSIFQAMEIVSPFYALVYFLK